MNGELAALIDALKQLMEDHKECLTSEGGVELGCAIYEDLGKIVSTAETPTPKSMPPEGK